MTFLSGLIVVAVFVTVVRIAPGILLNNVVAPGLVVFGLLQWLHMFGEKGMRKVLPPLVPSHTEETPTARKIQRLFNPTALRVKVRFHIAKDPRLSSRAHVIYRRDTVPEQSPMEYRLPLNRNCLPIQHQRLLVALLYTLIRSTNRYLLVNWDFNTVFRPFVVSRYYSKVWWALQFEESTIVAPLKKPPPPKKTVDSRALITFPEYQAPLPDDMLAALCDVFNQRLVIEDDMGVSAAKSYREYTAAVTNYSYTGTKALVRKGEQGFVLLRVDEIQGVQTLTTFSWSSLARSEFRDASLADGVVGLGVYGANGTQQGNAHTWNGSHTFTSPVQPSQTPTLIISRDNGTAFKRLRSSNDEVYSPNKRIKLTHPNYGIDARLVVLEKHAWFGTLLQVLVSKGVKTGLELPGAPDLNMAVQQQGQPQIQIKPTPPARSPKRKLDDGHCVQVQAEPWERAVKRLRYARNA